MTTKAIRTLKITHYKSIDSLELKGLTPFSVFAGPNGSGKTNFFDALDFVRLFILSGIETALRAHGGFASIHSEKRRAEHSGEFGFELECDLPEPELAGEEELVRFHYLLRIRDLDQNPPNIEERVYVNGALLLARKKDDVRVIQAGGEKDLGGFSKTHSFGAAVLVGDAACAIVVQHGVISYRSHRREDARSIG